MKLGYLLYFSLLIHLFSCQNAKIKGVEMELKTIEFEEMNHVNLKLIDSEFQILRSQNEIDKIYRIINKNNPSPRKIPIPPFEGNETYIVLQPKVKQSDFTVSEISENDQKIQITIQQYENPEYKDKKYPISIIRLNKKIDLDNVEIRQ